MIRELTGHKVNPANDVLLVAATDAPDAGGAHHRYAIFGFDNTKNASKFTVDEPTAHTVVLFQNGPINEVGVNGVTHEALLAIVIDRLQCFQAGPFACRENALALTNLEQAQMWLQKRTRDRMARGVEGTNAK
jgi:hypothetical protein